MIRVLITGTDVIHSWFVPSFGVQEYAMPGRLNETWMQVEHAGTYYGECNQICGINHAFMPIKVVAVSKPDSSIGSARRRRNSPPDAAATRRAAGAAADRGRRRQSGRATDSEEV